MLSMTSGKERLRPGSRSDPADLLIWENMTGVHQETPTDSSGSTDVNKLQGIIASRTENSGSTDVGGLSTQVVTPQTTTETSAISVVETSSIFVTQSTTDASAVSVADVSSSSITFSSTESAAVSVVETSGVFVTQPTTEASSVSVVETSAVSATVSTTDATSVSVVDASSSTSTLSTTDATSVSVVDTSSSTSTLSTTDATAVSVGDVSSLLVSQPGVESPALSVADSSAVAIMTALSTTDASSISVADSSAVAIVTAELGNEIPSISVAETSAVAVTQPTTETPSLSVAETSGIFYSFSSTDATSVSVADASARRLTYTNNNDAGTTDINKLQGVSTVRTDFSGSVDQLTTTSTTSTTEAAALSVSESSAVLILVSTTQAHSLSVSDVSARKVTYTDSDNSGTTDTNKSQGVGVIRTDFSGASDQLSSSFGASLHSTINSDSGTTDANKTMGIGASRTETSGSTDRLSAIKTVAIFRTDNDDSGSTDANQFASVGGWAGNGTDSAGSIDSMTVTVKHVTSDAAALSASETSSVLATTITPTTDAAAISVAETSAVKVLISAADATSISLTESDAEFESVAAVDSVLVGVSETSSVFVTQSTTDTSALSVVSTSTPLVQVASTLGSSLGVTESRTTSVTILSGDSITLAVSDHGLIRGKGYPVSVYNDGVFTFGTIKYYKDNQFIIPTIKKYTLNTQDTINYALNPAVTAYASNSVPGPAVTADRFTPDFTYQLITNVRTNIMPQPNPDPVNGLLTPGWNGYGSNTVVSIVGGVFRCTKTVTPSNNAGMNLTNNGTGAVAGFPGAAAGTLVTLYCEARLPTTNTVVKGIQLIARDDPNHDSSLLSEGFIASTNGANGSFSSVPTDNVWRPYFVTFVVPAGKTMTRVYVNGSGTNAAVGDYAEFRNIIVETNVLGTYFDGSTTDSLHVYGWSGTAYNSTSTQTQIAPIGPSGTLLNTAGRIVRNTANAGTITTGGFHVTGNNASTNPPAQAMAVTPGDVWSVSCWVRVSAVTNQKFAWVWRNVQSGAWLDATNIGTMVIPVAGQWVQVSQTITVPAGSDHLAISVQQRGGSDWNAGNTIDITGLLVEKTSSLGTYFDGNTPDANPNIQGTPHDTYIWNGTPNASTSTWQHADPAYGGQWL